MATAVVDEIYTKYILDPSGYTKGAAVVTQATQRLGTSIRSLGRAIPLALGLGSISGAAIVSLPLKAAASYDTMNRSLIAFTQTSERAAEVLRFVDALAIPSIFTTAQLGDAATTLEAFGLRAERFLPIAEKLGTVFGGTATDLGQFVNALGMLKGGRFGEAFESLARAGISRDLLKEQGLRFTKGGEFVGDINQAFDAVDRIVQARFGKLSAVMAAGPAAKWASTMDLAGRISRSFGFSIFSVVLPALTIFNDGLDRIVQSGKLERIGTRIAGMFSGEALGKGAVAILESAVGWLERLPSLFEQNRARAVEFMRSLKEGFVGFFNAAKPLAGVVANVGRTLIDTFNSLNPSLQTLVVGIATLQRLTGIGSGIASMAGTTLAKSAIGSQITQAIMGPIGMVGGALVLGAFYIKGVIEKAVDLLVLNKRMEAAVPGFVIETDPATGARKKRAPTASEVQAARRKAKQDYLAEKAGYLDYDDMMKDFESVFGSFAPAAPGGDSKDDDQKNQQTGYLRQIAENTRQALDFQQFAYGGGALGAVGVTPVEVGRINGGSRGGSTRIEKAVRQLVDAIQSEGIDTYRKASMVTR